MKVFQKKIYYFTIFQKASLNMNENKLHLTYSYPNEKEGILTLWKENNDNCTRVDALKFQTSTKAGLSDVYSALSRVSNTPQVIPKGNVDLVGYLYALSTAGELPSDELIDELTRCNATVNQTREHLVNGRANIMSDLIARPQLGREMIASRKITFEDLGDFDIKHYYASALFFRVGLCAENAVITSLQHSQKCHKNEIVKMISSDKWQHVWSESNHCVMDSWANGPSVLQEDAKCSAEESDECHSFSQEEGRQVMEKSAKYIKALEDFAEEKQVFNAYLERVTHLPMIFWPEMPVINKRLEESLNAKGFTSQQEPISINSQIRATGVLRGLGTAPGKTISIKEATSGCDEVINAFNTRFRTGYLGQWHSK